MNWTIDLTSTGTLICCVVFAVAFVLVCLYYGLIHWRVGSWKNSRVPEPLAGNDSRQPKVSVVLTAHNEAAYLKESLPYLLEQDYPDYEVVVVNYMSQDDTPFVLKVCGENYKHLKPIQFPEDVNMFQGKKYPLSIGIKSACGDVILTTEADCVPRTFTWLREMMAGYRVPGVQMVLGYAGVKEEPTLLNAMQQYDNLAETSLWMGFAIAGHPYSATGRNLAYRRDFFFQQGSFIRHYSEPDGADDMFVNQNTTNQNTVLCVASDSFVMAEAKPNMKQWRQQRFHRYATKRYYNGALKFTLRLYPFSVLLFYAALVMLAVLQFPWQYLLIMWLLKSVWQIWSFSRLTKRFEVKNVHIYAPLFEIYFVIANTFLYLSTLHKRNIRKK
jgi:glycosyltransferase involved in cell wall biosynthesis